MVFSMPLHIVWVHVVRENNNNNDRDHVIGLNGLGLGFPSAWPLFETLHLTQCGGLIRLKDAFSNV